MNLKTVLSLGLAGSLLLSTSAQAADYLIAPARPNKLVVVDAAAMAVEKVIEIEDAGPTPFIPVVDAAGRYAYVNINQTESIAKIDLLSGETVARRELGDAQTQVKSLFGLDLSPDGNLLAVYESPTALHLTHFEVLPTRISLLDTETLQTVRSFEVPRQITVIMFSEDGSKIYGLGRAMHVFDVASGTQIEEMPTQGWKPETYAPSDILDAWSQFETSGMLVTPYYTVRTDMSPEDPDSYRTGILSLDRASGEMEMRDVRALDVFYFSMAASPDHARAYGVYNVLESFDLEAGAPIKRVELPHSYYSVNVAPDGKTVWLGGALADLAAYDAETLEKKGQVDIPGGASMSLGSIRMFQRQE